MFGSFRVNADERLLSMRLGAILLINALTLNLSDAVAMTGILIETGSSGILWAWLGNMLIILATATVQTLLLDRFNRVKLLRSICIFVMLAYLILWLFFRLSLWPEASFVLLYILADQQWIFIPLVLWVLSNDLFTMSQARRIFPFITSWSLAGQVLGLGLAAAIPQLLPGGLSLVDLLLINSILFAGLVLSFRGFNSQHRQRKEYKQVSLQQVLSESFIFVRDVPLFRHLILSIVMAYIALTTIDFHFLRVSSLIPSLNDSSTYMSFYASYYLVITVILMLLQGLFASRLIERFALKNLLIILPTVLMLCLFGSLAFVGLISSAIAQAFSYLSKESIDDPAQKALQSLIPEERRGRVSLLLDSYLYAIGTIIACLMLGLINFFALRSPLLMQYQAAIYLSLTIAGITVSLIAILRMRRVYESNLLNWRLSRRPRGGSVLDKLDL